MFPGNFAQGPSDDGMDAEMQEMTRLLMQRAEAAQRAEEEEEEDDDFDEEVDFLFHFQ